MTRIRKLMAELRHSFKATRERDPLAEAFSEAMGATRSGVAHRPRHAKSLVTSRRIEA